MGKKDAITKKYLGRANVFADAFNQHVFRGRQVLLPERLSELDTTQIVLPYGDDGVLVPKQKFRDVLKLHTAMTDGETAFCIFGIEEESNIHYAAPVKNGLYDFMQLADQVAKASRSHAEERKRRRESESSYALAGDSGGEDSGRENADRRDSTNVGDITSGEFLSGFWKSDRLIPVVTLVIYFGAEKWDGPLTLREMYNCKDEELLAYTADYRVNLLAPGNMSDEEIALFRSDLREVMQYIKYSRDIAKLKSFTEGNDRFAHLDRETAEVINVVTNSKLKFDEKEEDVNMCLAMEQLREEGRQEGVQEGGVLKLIALVCRKLVKGKTPETIAEDLEEDFGWISRICDVAAKYAPEYDAEKIYAELSA